MADNKIKVGITQGDINGVGYEVIIKTLMEARMTELCTPVVYGSPKVAAYHRKLINAESFNFNIVRSAEEANPKRANIINVMGDEVKVEIGKATDAAGQGALAALKAAVQDVKDGKIQALVTAPFNKKTVQSAGHKFPGHTEFLASTFEAKGEIMVLMSDKLRVGVATGHIPLSKVPQALGKDMLVRKIRQLSNTLKEDFLLRRPRIAVLSLNPHAGDGGLLGEEEQGIIIPAIEEAIKGGTLAFGPYAADGFFGAGSMAKFDAVLAMYHDQGLAPFKAIAFGAGVNYTGGLPIIRTAPAHGTAYDIAGRDQASPESFRAALYMACDAYKNRKAHADLLKNALPLGKADQGKRE